PTDEVAREADFAAALRDIRLILTRNGLRSRRPPSMSNTSALDPSPEIRVGSNGSSHAGGNADTGRVESRLAQLGTLLADVESDGSVATITPSIDVSPQTGEHDVENHLAQVRLGLASSLFTALRCRDSATANHSVRVALGCSAWALAMELP